MHAVHTNKNVRELTSLRLFQFVITLLDEAVHTLFTILSFMSLCILTIACMQFSVSYQECQGVDISISVPICNLFA